MAINIAYGENVYVVTYHGLSEDKSLEQALSEFDSNWYRW